MTKQLIALLKESKETETAHYVVLHKQEVDRLIEAFEHHQVRVTELIRANSEQVVRRRVLAARIKIYERVIGDAINQFRKYAKLHFAKDTPSGQEKGEANMAFVEHLEVALDTRINPEDYGRP